MSKPPRRILLLGRDGQVGWELQRTLAPLGEVVALGRAELDLGDTAAIRARVRALRPQVIVNAAAYTAVDRAEREPEAAFAVNARAPGILAEEAQRLGALLVHYSTDYVFDGRKREPYTEQDEPNPLNVYGASKLEGERAVQAAAERHLVFRTGWVYGLRGNNFLLTMLRLFREREEVRVVADQIGAPTWSRLIAEATAQALAVEARCGGVPSGIYHLSAAGQTSWHGFAEAILVAMPGPKRARAVVPIRTEEYPTTAARPRYSVLDSGRLADTIAIRLPAWERQIELALADGHAHPAEPGNDEQDDE